MCRATFFRSSPGPGAGAGPDSNGKAAHCANPNPGIEYDENDKLAAHDEFDDNFQ